MTLSRELAHLLARPVDDAARQRAVLHVLDWSANAALGATAVAGHKIAAYGRDQPEGPCHAIGAGRRSAEIAAFVNGALGNLFELDDIHRTSIVHPGDVVVPAALAAAERAGCDGVVLLDAIVRGYEAAIRIGSAAGRGHYAFWYNTATCGTFGAAVAAADILGLDETGVVDALGQAGSQASGLWQCRIETTDTKQVLTARAAQAGLLAADLAALGLRGPTEILEGECGFFAAMAPGADFERVLAAAGGPWCLYEVSFKPWPACRHAHPAIDAALSTRNMVEPAEIERIEVETYAEAIEFCDQPHPTTPHAARFSLQYCVARALLDGVPRLEHFTPEAIADPGVSTFAGKVAVIEDESMTAAFPERYPARVTLRLADGRSAVREVVTALGDPESPISTEDLVAKSRAQLRTAGCSAVASDGLVAASFALNDGGSPADILAPLRENALFRSKEKLI